MEILLKEVTVIDPASDFHQQQVDVFIQNGFITEIGHIERSSDQTVALQSLHVSPGFTDVFAHFCDPGFEFRETLESGALSAAHGCFTDVFVVPNTVPVVHQKAGVCYIVQQGKSLPVNLHPIGAVSKNAEGKELAEMYDMHQSGAVAFSDGTSALQSSGLLLKALQYVKAIDKTVIQIPDDLSISAGGLMNEGIVSTQLGLPGKPAIAEELMIRRDIELAKYTGSRLHVTGVSTAKGIDYIRKAKEDGLQVSCSVTPAHLYFSEEDLTTYDTNLKLLTPLRTTADRQALRDAVLDGTIDCIASHHIPHHTDHKVVEFEYAKPGMIALETAFAVVRSCLPSLALERLVALFSITPRKIFGLPSAGIKRESAACLSLFLPDKQWVPDTFFSRSKNSPFTGLHFTGYPVGIINGHKVILRSL